MDQLQKIDTEIAAVKEAIDDIEARINELDDELEPLFDRLLALEEQRIDVGGLFEYLRHCQQQKIARIREEYGK